MSRAAWIVAGASRRCCWRCLPRTRSGAVAPRTGLALLIALAVHRRRRPDRHAPAAEPDRLAVPGLRRRRRGRLRGATPTRTRALVTDPGSLPGGDVAASIAAHAWHPAFGFLVVRACCCSPTAGCSRRAGAGSRATVVPTAAGASAGLRVRASPRASRRSTRMPASRCSAAVVDESLGRLRLAAALQLCSLLVAGGVARSSGCGARRARSASRSSGSSTRSRSSMFAFPVGAVRARRGVRRLPVPADPDRGGGGDPQVPALRHRRRDQPHAGLRRADGDPRRRVSGQRAAVAAAPEPELGPRDRGIDARGRGAVPAGPRTHPGARGPPLLPPPL